MSVHAVCRRIVLLLLLAGLLAGCGPAVTPMPAAGDANALHTLVSVSGQVSVKRQGWTQYAPLLFGAGVRLGDLLRLDVGAKALLACADLTLVNAPAGVGGLPCKVAQPILTYAGSLLSATRADVPPAFPQIVAPRKTKILNPRPVLRWLSAGAGARYKVTVQGPGVTWSAEVVDQTELVYPADAPALQAGAAYKLKVEAGGRSSDLENLPGLGFTLLSDADAKAARAAEEKIRALKLEDAPARLLLANLYISKGLDAEAIGLLESLAAEKAEPAVRLALSDLYLKSGVNSLAEEGYLAALKLSEAAGDIEGQAAALRALGLLAEARGNPGEAAGQWKASLALYEKLGDAKMMKELGEHLK